MRFFIALTILSLLATAGGVCAIAVGMAEALRRTADVWIGRETERGRNK